MADAQSASRFVMHGARAVFAAESPYIEQQVVAIERAVEESPGLAIDMAKTLTESVCKTILKDRGYPYDEGWDLPKLLKETLGRLRLAPDGLDDTAEVTGSLKKTVGGLQTAIHGLCELRNTHGFASHGKDALWKPLEIVQAIFAARSADAVVSFLFGVHRQYTHTEPVPPMAYSDNTAFNSYLDEANDPVRIGELVFSPSEVIFHVDPKAYRDLLADYDAKGDEGMNKSPEVSGPEVNS